MSVGKKVTKVHIMNLIVELQYQDSYNFNDVHVSMSLKHRSCNLQESSPRLHGLISKRKAMANLSYCRRTSMFKVLATVHISSNFSR